MDFIRMCEQIKEDGPTRVVVDGGGLGVPPRRAREQFHIVPSVIFIRSDGWSCGAPREFEAVAYGLWKREWIGFMRRGEDVIRPMTEYHGG